MGEIVLHYRLGVTPPPELTPLETLLADMRRWSHWQDKESAHEMSDQTLCRALLRLAHAHPEQATIDAIVTVWREINRGDE